MDDYNKKMNELLKEQVLIEQGIDQYNNLLKRNLEEIRKLKEKRWEELMNQYNK